MAIKSSDQISLQDLTDGFSVTLTSDGYTFTGTTDHAVAGSTTTQIKAMCGTTTVGASVTLSEITKPTGITVTKDSDATAPTLTIAASTSFTTAGIVNIPVHISYNGSTITINKIFAVGIAFAGANGQNGRDGQDGHDGQDGQDGVDGADAIMLKVISSNGLIFKNTAVATTLTAHVYKGGAEVTGSALAALGTIKWYKDNGTTPVATGASLTVSAGDVQDKATYTCQLEA